ncbi:MAG TPA: hypothetical protein PKV73_16620 [Agriterribacter sp.]|nr:hypothetical protein [Agriterribacter sp.]
MVETPVALPAVSPETVKQRLSIALTKATVSIQALQDEADSLVFNEDQENIDRIAVFLGKVRKGEKTIEDEHKVIKEPFLEGGRACDAAKKDMLAAIAGVKTPVHSKYTTLCAEIDRKKQEAERQKEVQRKILEGIETNVMTFSQQIAECTTKSELLEVERRINLEKAPSRAAKYGDHHATAIEKFNTVLLPILKDQKSKIEDRERLQSVLAKTEDAEKHAELMQKLDEKDNEILQNQVKVQEQALQHTAIGDMEPEILMPTVKQTRTDIVCEIVDVQQVFKKSPELLNIELKLAEAKKRGQLLKDAGSFGDKDELTVNGIKYSIKKKW